MNALKTIVSFFMLLAVLSPVLAATSSADSAITESAVTLETKTGKLFGTLTTPAHAGTVPVALIIAGSGPTDRDGNNTMMHNNSLKLLAGELAAAGIATVRYDKRGIAESMNAGATEADLRFDMYVDDAKEWVNFLREHKQFSSVVIIGHSEGSLIGMIAAQTADKFVSIAGAGEPADKIIKRQMIGQPQAVKDVCFPILDSLKNGKLVDNVLPMFYNMFRPSVQPYMISWLRYDPAIEIAKLAIPVLLVQGTNDIQVSVDDAKRLATAYPKAQLVLIDKMNHIFRTVEGDRAANIAAYTNASLPIAPRLATSIAGFILGK